MSGTLTTPTSGQPNSTEDPKIATAVSTLNGLLDASNKLDGAQLSAVSVAAAALASNSVTTAKITDANVTDAKLASPNNGIYRTLESARSYLNGTVTAGTLLLGASLDSGGFPTKSGIDVTLGQSSPPNVFYFDDADFTVASKTTKLRLRAQLLVNNTAPGINFTFGLYPVSSMSGAAGLIDYTLGTVITGSTIAFSTPSGTSRNQNVTSDFDVPADGYYVFGVVSSGSNAANSASSLHAQLQMRHV